MLTVKDFDKWCRSFLEISLFEGSDASLNGLQIGDEGASVKKVAFAVDACLATMEKAVQEKADLLFVHHGLFWGKPVAIKGDHYRRVKKALDNNLALYAVHLPLDQHPEYGNNAGLARILGLKELKGFGRYKGNAIGLWGRLDKPLRRDDVIPALFGGWGEQARMLPFGPREIQRVGILSGGGCAQVAEALELGLELYITGDACHTVYHQSLEGGINVLFGGHYLTETSGVRGVMKKTESELELSTVFIDVPTAL